MTASNNNMRTLQLAVRWTARLSSLVIIIVFILMFIGEGFHPGKVKPIEWIMLLFGPFGFILGMILGWWKEVVGGAVTVLSYFGALLVGGYSLSGASYLLVCAAPGLLFLLSWFLSRFVVKNKNEAATDGNPPQSSSEGNTSQ